VALAWYEAHQYGRQISAAKSQREYGPVPETLRTLSIEALIKGARGQRGKPIFVIPFAERRRACGPYALARQP
jgi:hypothetical protein